MAENNQNYSNHTRRHPLFHFVLVPILIIHLVWSFARFIEEPSPAAAEALLLSIGLVVMMNLVRIYPLKAQDRLIRLEEELRFHRVLPAGLAPQASALPVRFLVALRFASDEELPELVRKVLDGKFEKPRDVKRAIKNWRADYLRV